MTWSSSQTIFDIYMYNMWACYVLWIWYVIWIWLCDLDMWYGYGYEIWLWIYDAWIMNMWVVMMCYGDEHDEHDEHEEHVRVLWKNCYKMAFDL